MPGSADIVVERQPGQLMIPIHASFTEEGNPSVFLQKGDEFVPHLIEVGHHNETDIVVMKGLEAGDIVALETPAAAARRARKPQ